MHADLLVVHDKVVVEMIATAVVSLLCHKTSATSCQLVKLIVRCGAHKQRVRAWIAAWRQRTTHAEALTAEAAAVAVGQPPSMRSSQQQALRAALSSTSSLPDEQAAGPSGTDDNEQSMRAARQGDLPQCLAPGAWYYSRERHFDDMVGRGVIMARAGDNTAAALQRLSSLPLQKRERSMRRLRRRSAWLTRPAR